jgi:DNA-binding NarL/FixJ family response regulator
MREISEDSNLIGILNHGENGQETSERRVLIATHQTMVSEGLKRIISETLSGARFGQVSDSSELLQEIQNSRWDLAIVDVQLQGCNCVALVKELKKKCAGMNVMVFGACSNPRLVWELVAAGASGYLNRESSLEDLKRALQTVFSGGNYLDELMLDRCPMAPGNGTERLIRELLSLRERQVMVMIASGKSSKEIAWDLSLSVKTISTYRARVLKKTKMKSNADLIRYTIENKLEAVLDE